MSATMTGKVKQRVKGLVRRLRGETIHVTASAGGVSIAPASAPAGADPATLPTIQNYTRVGSRVALAIVQRVGGAPASVRLPGGAAIPAACVRIARVDGVSDVVVFPIDDSTTTVEIVSGSTVWPLNLRHEHLYADPGVVAHHLIAPADSNGRLGVIKAIEQHVSALDGADPTAFRPLQLMREPLQRRYAPVPPHAFHAHADMMALVDGRGLYVRGWVRDYEAPARSIVVLTPDGQEIDLLAKALTYDRPDLEDTVRYPGKPAAGMVFGFSTYAELPRRCPSAHGWQLKVEDLAGNVLVVPTSAPLTDVDEVTKEVLQEVGRTRGSEKSEAIFRELLEPPLAKLTEIREAQFAVETVIDYGFVSKTAEVSVIVPLYKRIDFLEHQLAQFTLDPEFLSGKIELVYVLDSPEVSYGLKMLCVTLFEIYGVPFRLVYLKKNCGYSAANNFGVAHSSAPRILLLNSDVLPESPGWMSRLVASYDAQARVGVGAVGPKLVYEDETLQHAGMFFHRGQVETDWANWHYFKGLHRTHPEANVARRVPAVTGACLMLSRADYQAIGGLHGQYIFGDFEDSDLCLRLAEMGKPCWYDPSIQLYHLEGQSYPNQVRAFASRYNMWLHTRTWGKQIEKLMKASESWPA